MVFVVYSFKLLVKNNGTQELLPLSDFIKLFAKVEIVTPH